MNAQDFRSGVTQFSDSMLVGLLALAFALADGFAQLILGLAFLASFAAFVASAFRQRPETKASREE